MYSIRLRVYQAMVVDDSRRNLHLFPSVVWGNLTIQWAARENRPKGRGFFTTICNDIDCIATAGDCRNERTDRAHRNDT